MKLNFLLFVMLLALPIYPMNMTKPQPFVFYKIKTQYPWDDPVAVKVLQTGCAITNLNDTEILSHNSPEIANIHDKKYLDKLQKHPSAMLAAINNKPLMSLLPNAYSRAYLNPMLIDATTTLVALKMLIEKKDNPLFQPYYTVSLGSGGSFAGYDKGCNGDVYASIPIAAAYALTTQQFKHILVIDENIDNAHDKYFHSGNGMIFYSKKSDVFKDNDIQDISRNSVFMHDQINSYPHNTTYDLFNKIDLVLYNIDIEVLNKTNVRLAKLTSLFTNLIPTVIILSGDKNKNIDQACNILSSITQTAQNYLDLQPKTPITRNRFTFDSDKESCPELIEWPLSDNTENQTPSEQKSQSHQSDNKNETTSSEHHIDYDNNYSAKTDNKNNNSNSSSSSSVERGRSPRVTPDKDNRQSKPINIIHHRAKSSDSSQPNSNSSGESDFDTTESTSDSDGYSSSGSNEDFLLSDGLPKILIYKALPKKSAGLFDHYQWRLKAKTITINDDKTMDIELGEMLPLYEKCFLKALSSIKEKNNNDSGSCDIESYCIVPQPLEPDSSKSANDSFDPLDFY